MGTEAWLWAPIVARLIAASWRKVSLPDWLHYLHFHEIKRWVGLPTAALIAFMIGLGCVVGAIGVSLFYRASNLAEFQAIQMWRIEWLLAATASFVAGILLKKPSIRIKDTRLILLSGLPGQPKRPQSSTIRFPSPPRAAAGVMR